MLVKYEFLKILRKKSTIVVMLVSLLITAVFFALPITQYQTYNVVPQNKIPVSCAKTANYNRIFINLSLTVCQKNGTLFFLCVSEISVIVVLVATDKKRERTTPTTARSFSHP